MKGDIEDYMRTCLVCVLINYGLNDHNIVRI